MHTTVKPLSNYHSLTLIGSGTYGNVYKAYDSILEIHVALKEVGGNGGDGFPITSIRELHLLKKLQGHPNILQVMDVVTCKSTLRVFLVFELCQCDLTYFFHELAVPLTLGHIKTLVKGVLEGLDYMHERYILHRDLKMTNLLIDSCGSIKIGDFGLARESGHAPGARAMLTPKVVTLWYRAPELILGTSSYHTGIDIWALGCIFGELLCGDALLPGSNELDMFTRICSLIGTPTPQLWETHLSHLPHAGFIDLPTTSTPPTIAQRVPQIFSSATDLLSQMLEFDPSRRITARRALNHPFFNESPLPQNLPIMNGFES